VTAMAFSASRRADACLGGPFVLLAPPVMSLSLREAMKVESNAFLLEFPWRLNFLSPLKLPR
jgi:hypothetical protein